MLSRFVPISLLFPACLSGIAVADLLGLVRLLRNGCSETVLTGMIGLFILTLISWNSFQPQSRPNKRGLGMHSTPACLINIQLLPPILQRSEFQFQAVPASLLLVIVFCLYTQYILCVYEKNIAIVFMW
jgi:hypothetical protein